jgi:hypothetical protein
VSWTKRGFLSSVCSLLLTGSALANFAQFTITVSPSESPPAVPASLLFQHVAGGAEPATRGLSCNSFKFFPPNPSGAGNCYVLWMTYPNGSTPTVTDTNGNSWPSTPTIHANAGSGNNDSACFLVPNVVAGQNKITITFGATVEAFSYTFTELFNIDPTPNHGTTSTAFLSGPTLNAGSFTPTNNNSGGGNLLLAYFMVAESTSATTVTTLITPSTNFTLLDASINEQDSQYASYRASQMFLQSASAAINPGITATGDTDHWNSLAIALKVNTSAGTAPPPPSAGIRVLKVLHGTTVGAVPTSYKLQVPTMGNLGLLMCDGTGQILPLTVKDNASVNWTEDSVDAGFWFRTGMTANSNSNLEVTLSSGGGSTSVSFRYMDIVGPTATLDTAVASNQNVSSVTSFTTSPAIAPTGSSGLIVWNIGLGQGPGLNITAPAGAVWDLVTYTGEVDLDEMENADITAHANYSSPGSVPATFQITSISNDSTSGGMIAFHV